MKKNGKTLLLALCLSSSMFISAFASELPDDSGLVGPVEKVVSVYEEEPAVSLSPLTRAASGISYGWRLDADAGLISGITAYATSTAFVTGNPSDSMAIDYMYVKVVLTRTNGNTTESETDNGVSELTCYLYDANQSNTFKSIKSTHTFKNAGYSDTTKYVTKTL